MEDEWQAKCWKVDKSTVSKNVFATTKTKSNTTIDGNYNREARRTRAAMSEVVWSSYIR